MAHKHSVYDTDPHFAIDPITREIVNKSTDKTKLIQYDHNSERFTFEIPRLVDGHDMSQCDKIEIHYINVDAATKEFKKDVFKVKDKQISPAGDDVVIFSWLISKNATGYAGTLNFLIKFSCLTGSTIDYDWHTDIHKGISVGGGMNNGETVIAEYSDVLEAWKAEILAEVDVVLAEKADAVLAEKADAVLDKKKDAAIAEIEAKGQGVLDSITADHTEMEENLISMEENLSLYKESTVIPAFELVLRWFVIVYPYIELLTKAKLLVITSPSARVRACCSKQKPLLVFHS